MAPLYASAGNLHIAPMNHSVVMQDFSRPTPCSFLQGGQHFHGTQRVSQPSATALEDWGVQVTIEVFGQLTQEHQATSSNCSNNV